MSDAAAMFTAPARAAAGAFNSATQGPGVTQPPAVASSDNPETAAAMQKASEDANVNRARGMAANMLAGAYGGSGGLMTGGGSVARNTLLGA